MKGVSATQEWSQAIAMWTDCSLPTSPCRTASRIKLRCGAQRPCWLTARTTPRAVGELGEALALGEVEDERLLRQHVLVVLERRLDHRPAHLGMRRQVDDLDVVARQRRRDVVGRLGVGEELVAPRDRMRRASGSR